MDLIDDAQAVLDEYRDHWPLTVRQVFYRLAGAHGYEKTDRFYNRLCHHLANARRGRLISFDAIRDDGVSVVGVNHYLDADHFYRQVRELGERYRRDRLAHQAHHIEVWCEAAGMVYQLADVARHYSISVYSSSGFDSLTAKKILADRIVDIGKPAVILHLGDFDPSGQSIYEAAAEDVAAFVEAGRDWMLTDVEFRRVALTDDQVTVYDLPTTPAKATDGRSKGWKGETCQLEALPPDVIAQILREAITDLIDLDRLAEDQEAEEQERRAIRYSLPRGGSQ